MNKKVKIRNSKYKTTNINFQVVSYFIIAILFSLISIYFIYSTIKVYFSSGQILMGDLGIVLILCLIFLTIIFWYTAIQTFKNDNIYNILTQIGKISVEYLEFTNDGIFICEKSSKFKIEYNNIKAMEFFISANVISGKYYLKSLNLNITYSTKEGLKDIAITQEPSLMVMDQIYDILYFSQKCPNFTLKFPEDYDLLQTTLGKDISSYLKNNYHHTFRSFIQTSKGFFILVIAIILLILITLWSQFI